MAQHGNLDIPAHTWTQLTNADATKITFQNLSVVSVYIEGTTSATPPTGVTGALYPCTEGERNVLLSELFPGKASVRVWAYATAPALVFRSHN